MITSINIDGQQTREPPVRQDKTSHKGRNRKYEDTDDEEDKTEDEDTDDGGDAGDDGYKTNKDAKGYRRNRVGK